MPLTKERKEELVAEYTDMLENSRAIIFTEYRGLSNKELTQIRRDIREANGRYRVTKLSLLKLAMEQAGMPVPEEMLSGAPVAVGFCFEEIPGVAKALSEFADESDLFVLRGGLMDTQPLSQQEIEALADLPTLDELRAQLAGLLQAPASNLVGVLQAGVAAPLNVIQAYIQAGEGQ